MKAYTDIEQSKKLAEILPIDTADMWWSWFSDPFDDVNGGKYDIEPMLHKPVCDPDKAIPCWSLVTLLNVIKPINENTYTIRGTLDGGAIISFNEVTSVMFQEKEIIDAVFEMVVWLKEIGKL